MKIKSPSGLLMDFSQPPPPGEGYGILAFAILKLLSLTSITTAGLIVIKNHEELYVIVNLFFFFALSCCGNAIFSQRYLSWEDLRVPITQKFSSPVAFWYFGQDRIQFSHASVYHNIGELTYLMY